MNSDAPRIRTEVQVMFFDTDCGGVVSNIAYLRFIEIARTQLARPADDALIAECRQTLALIEMPAAKLLPLPADWEKYRARTSSA